MEVRFTDLADESRESDWFDPSDYEDVGEFRTAVLEWVTQVPGSFEFAVSDESDSPVVIPRFTRLSELMELEEAIDDYWDIGALRAYANNESWSIQDCINGMDEAMDNYRGEFSSGEDFAKNWAEECGDYNPRRADWPMNHIDWEAAWEDIEDQYTVIDDHYFSDF